MASDIEASLPLLHDPFDCLHGAASACPRQKLGGCIDSSMDEEGKDSSQDAEPQGCR